MATEILRKQGTTVTWAHYDGDETISTMGMTDGNGRAGDEHDFGATWPTQVLIQFQTDFASSPTAGEVVDIYWSPSPDGTNYDGECSGSDEAYNDENDMKRLRWVGSLVCTNDTDVQRQSWDYYLPSRYGLPVISNQSGQTFGATGTNQSITVTPIIDEAQ